LVPGEQVTIAWEINTNGRNTDTAILEQEIFLSTDGGKHIAARITPQLSGNVTSAQWTVPNLPAKRATLILAIGCDSCGTTNFEVRYPQKHATFRIMRAPSGSEAVTVTSARETTEPDGRNVSVSWSSTVSDASHFEIRASYDRGAHFQVIGESTSSSGSFTWKIPSSVDGRVTLMVVAVKSTGDEVSSLMMDPARVVAAAPAGADSQ
ncbi:MAG TPA: hypothetical protein VJX67_12660, partial [Blastocatellia bacterium]|nr:hypothetical protein [Blastocatellia bacterium]